MQLLMHTNKHTCRHTQEQAQTTDRHTHTYHKKGIHLSKRCMNRHLNAEGNALLPDAEKGHFALTLEFSCLFGQVLSQCLQSSDRVMLIGVFTRILYSHRGMPTVIKGLSITCTPHTHTCVFISLTHIIHLE